MSLRLYEGLANAWIYYLIGGLLLALFIAFLVFFFIHRANAVKFFKHKVWKTLYRLAQNEDWYLLNDVVIKTEEESLHMSHLLVGSKFVYVISSRYYEADLAGESYVSRKWHVVDKNGVTLREVSNPVLFNERRTMVLAKFLGWNNTKTPMFISIVVINDSSAMHIKDNGNISSYSFIVHRKDLTKLIRRTEKEYKFPPFDQNTLDKMIPRLHRLSEETKEEEERKNEYARRRKEERKDEQQQ